MTVMIGALRKKQQTIQIPLSRKWCQVGFTAAAAGKALLLWLLLPCIVCLNCVYTLRCCYSLCFPAIIIRWSLHARPAAWPRYVICKAGTAWQARRQHFTTVHGGMVCTTDAPGSTTSSNTYEVLQVAVILCLLKKNCCCFLAASAGSPRMNRLQQQQKLQQDQRGRRGPKVLRPEGKNLYTSKPPAVALRGSSSRSASPGRSAAAEYAIPTAQYDLVTVVKVFLQYEVLKHARRNRLAGSPLGHRRAQSKPPNLMGWSPLPQGVIRE